MTLQTIKLGKKEFVVIARRDFDRLAADASRQREDEYWTEAALAAEARAKAKRQTTIPFDRIERQLDARRGGRRASARR